MCQTAIFGHPRSCPHRPQWPRHYHRIYVIPDHRGLTRGALSGVAWHRLRGARSALGQSDRLAGNFASVEKTGKLLVVDPGATTGSVAGEIVARVAIERMASPNVRTRAFGHARHAGTNEFRYDQGLLCPSGQRGGKGAGDAGPRAGRCRFKLAESTPHDVPGAWFTGPFRAAQ